MAKAKQRKDQNSIGKRSDGYVDINKKIGTKVRNNSGFVLDLGDDYKFASIYVGNGMAKRYIDLLVDDMTRRWIEIPEDTDGVVLKKLQKLKAKTQFKGALRASKLFGGSVIFMVIEDGGEPSEAVNFDSIKTVSKLKFFSRKYITIDPSNYYKDNTKSNFGEPEYFTITTPNGQLMTVHESRCLVFKGEYYPQEELGETPGYDKYWGLSALTSLHEAFEDYGLALQALSRSLTKSNVDVLKIKNLMKLLANPDGKKLLDARTQMFDISKSISTTLLLDNDESYEAISQAFAGVAEVFSKIESSLSGMCGIPGNIFFGIPTKGLNSTGDNEQRTYYEKINSDQEEEMLEPLEKLTNLISLSKDFKGKKIEDPEIKFKPLWEPTEKEEVEIRNKQADTDEKYINMGVVDPDEIRESRFGGKKYSIQTVVEGPAPDITEPNETKNNSSNGMAKGNK
jgi:phage-related protein (TIGR01555 family)